MYRRYAEGRYEAALGVKPDFHDASIALAQRRYERARLLCAAAGLSGDGNKAAKGHDGAGNEDAETVHEDNDWGIEVCDESEPAPAAAAAAAAPAAAGPGAGLEFKYAPAAAGAPADEDDGAAEEDGGQSIEDLMASLQAASS